MADQSAISPFLGGNGLVCVLKMYFWRNICKMYTYNDGIQTQGVYDDYCFYYVKQ